MMAGIKSGNTSPELILRRGLHARGFRFRLNRRNLPGSPDLVFPARNAALFAHGCFWHGHDCKLFRWPRTRETFWKEKISGNRRRDFKNAEMLLTAGWRVGIVWECALKGIERRPLADVLDACDRWLNSKAAKLEVRGSETGTSLGLF